MFSGSESRVGRGRVVAPDAGQDHSIDFKRKHETSVSTVESPAPTPARLFESQFQQERARYFGQSPPGRPETPDPGLTRHVRRLSGPPGLCALPALEAAGRFRARPRARATPGLRVPDRQCFAASRPPGRAAWRGHGQGGGQRGGAQPGAAADAREFPPAPARTGRAGGFGAGGAPVHRGQEAGGSGARFFARFASSRNQRPMNIRRTTKFCNDKGAALRRPDGAARRPYQRDEEFCPAPMNIGQRILILMIRGYQMTVSPALPVLFGPAGRCRFTPSCSQYAREAIQTHGVLAGGALAAGRLCRCNPWGASGEDAVPAARMHRRLRLGLRLRLRGEGMEENSRKGGHGS
jgi:putative membrane protein insertion efficiency factor